MRRCGHFSHEQRQLTNLMIKVLSFYFFSYIDFSIFSSFTLQTLFIPSISLSLSPSLLFTSPLLIKVYSIFLLHRLPLSLYLFLLHSPKLLFTPSISLSLSPSLLFTSPLPPYPSRLPLLPPSLPPSPPHHSLSVSQAVGLYVVAVWIPTHSNLLVSITRDHMTVM